MYDLSLKFEQQTYEGAGQEPKKEWVTLLDVTVVDAQVLAGILRSQANKLDPPKPATRGFE